MPAATNSYTVDALKGQAVMKQLKDTVTEIQNRIGARLFEHAARYHGYVAVDGGSDAISFLAPQ